jgi:transcriptional regulator of met regulon
MVAKVYAVPRKNIKNKQPLPVQRIRLRLPLNLIKIIVSLQIHVDYKYQTRHDQISESLCTQVIHVYIQKQPRLLMF